MRPLLRLLVRLFPPAFREQFGADMLEQIGSDGERARARGPLTALGFFLATAADLVVAALAERVRPSWAGARGTVTRGTRGEGGGWTMDGWTEDLRLALRSLGRTPGFAAVAVGTLGLAIGANAGIFSVVDAVLLDPLPYADTGRLVYVAASAPGSDLPEEFGVSQEFLLQYGEATLLEELAGYQDFTNTLRLDDRAERVRMAAGSTSLLSTLGATPLLGRLPVPEDEDRVVVISHALWTGWFGADPAVVGRTLDLLGGSRTIVGVMGPGFWFPSEETVLWAPFVIRPEAIVPGRFGGLLVARMTPDATREALTDELTRLARRLPERFGGTPTYARIIEQHRPVVRPLQQELLGWVSEPLWLLLGAVGVVLLIACANVANLFVVRGERRQRDLAVRRAIGAARGHLVRLQLAEAVVVAALAGAAAVLLAWVGVPLFLRGAPAGIPRVDEVGLSGTLLLFTLATSVLAALLCGLVPALRGASPDLAGLKDGSRGSTRRRHAGRNALVVAQTALALVLLIGSALLGRSLLRLRDVDPGYDTRDVFTFQIAPEADHLVDPASFARFHLDFLDRLAALPGVASVGIIENVPLNEGVASARFRTAETADAEGGALLGFTYTAGDYFLTMGIELLEGRVLGDADHASEPGNVLVSRAAADLLWPGRDALGQRVQREGLETWETVVGVVEDVRQYDFRVPPQPLVYFPLVEQAPGNRVVSTPAYVVKTTRTGEIAAEVRALVGEVAPGAPMYRVFTMEGLASDSMNRLSFTALILGVASALALLLGTIGLYGVLSWVVAERTREIGVRMALGAEAGRVQRMVVAEGARVVVLGVALGALAALASTRVLGTLLFGVEAVDAATFLAMSALMTAVGLLASWVPARRASLVDPIQSLRGD